MLFAVLQRQYSTNIFSFSSPYISSLAAVNILQAHITSDLGEFMNKISLLSGILASILLLLILVLAFGWFALILWTACLVTVVTKSYQSLKTLLYTTVADASSGSSCLWQVEGAHELPLDGRSRGPAEWAIP
ncbi:hypothetical protein PRUPE_3G260700 [Prunus persica]|uniref:Uncharacterized protein n=1 Tax=Prunus persica TaxID=3760 RepID=M5WRM9_PRUPE|nr:hypothetical protein PRUPE_3G260700 [Prunus persica]